MEKTHFLVPFAAKDQAKARGARWDASVGLWYAPSDPVAQRMGEVWPVASIQEPLANLLPGEDRAFGGNELFIDLVPKSCWFTNVRSCIDAGSWARLSRLTRERASHRCEACGSPANVSRKLYLEAHERWDYNPATRTQTLRRIVTLCTPCHLVTHWGYAKVSGRERQARAHFKAVAGIDDQAVDQRVAAAFTLWAQRSQQSWQLDLSMLSTAGLVLVKPANR